jgi:uncharacterized protein (UPF0332 family)
MDFEWENYLQLAKDLDKHSDEASKRSAISRSYYAAFCVARNWLRKNNPDFTIPSTVSAHKVVWEVFQNSDDDLKKEIGNYGIALRRTRRKADYDNSMATPEKSSRDAIIRTDAILKALHDISSGSHETK